MKSILLFAFLLFLSNSFAQLDKRTYLNKDFDTCSIAQARYYTEYKRSETDQHVVKNVYKLDGSQISVITFLNDSLNVFYENGEIIKGSIYDDKGMVLPYEKYFVEAVYPGGNEAMMKFIMENVVYPEDAIIYEIEGKVYIQFIVDSLGNVKKPKVVGSISPILSEAALDVIDKMPKWTPGRIDGENFDSYFQLPINFNLDGGESNVNKRLLANLFWTKKDKLMDPLSNDKINVSKRGKTTIYFKDADSEKTKSASLTVKELEAFRNLKFESMRSCYEWYKLYNQQKVEDLKKMGR